MNMIEREPPINPPNIEDDGHISNEELEDLRLRNIERAYETWKEGHDVR